MHIELPLIVIKSCPANLYKLHVDRDIDEASKSKQ
jgi:hypothetical protein